VAQYIEEIAARTEAVLAAYLDAIPDASGTLLEANRYSLLGAGKRLRPALVLGTTEMLAGDDAPALPAACAIEMIHTYSLIHDDLPAMDNDDLRRGKPTSHKAFGEATAILAGDALLTMAFDFAATSRNVQVIREIAQAAGVGGMAGGQQLDLESESKRISLPELRRVHAWKTGALIRCSVRCGALLAGAGEDTLAALTAYGDRIGLAFQIADDILNVTGTEEQLGKPVGSDATRQKSTYPALVGLERSRELADEAAAAAIAELHDFGPKADRLRAMARFVVERDK
ncbi:MAG: polyprenyl synthetase family protein, partial [Candidatus Hydrogenedentes bacterium]|nr:polyprenyl synthetase family protein [Candidatus Hydrogenedentota bacterium]